MADSGTYDQATITRRQRIAEQMLADSSKPRVIRNPIEGLGYLANVGADTFALNRLDKQAGDARKADTAALMSILNGGGAQPSAPSGVASPSTAPSMPPPSPTIIGAGGPAKPDAQSVYDADAVMMPPSSAAADSSQPRGIRNNNPLNIEAGSFTQGQPGFSGSDGRFARFAEPQQGIDAAGKLLDTYQDKHGLNTVRGIIGRWAPSSENDTNGYVASVAGRLGINPDQPLTPEQRPALIAAMGQFENGRPIGGKPAVASAMSPMAFNGEPSPSAAFPPPSAPAPPAPAPAAPGALPNNQPSGIPPQQRQAIAALMMATPGSPAQQLGIQLAAQSLKPHDFTHQTLPDGTILRLDPTGKAPPQVVYQAQAKPQFVPNVGANPYGVAQPGFVDPLHKQAFDISGKPIAAASQSGSTAGGGPAGPDVTGDAFLSTLPKTQADQIKGITEGRIAPPGAFALKTPYWQKMLTDVAQYEPGFDLTKWGARAATAKDFASGKSAQNITAFNTVLQHLDTLDKAATSLNNYSFTPANTLANYIKSKTGDPAIKNFEVAKTAVADELTRAFRGTGGNVHDLTQWENAINAANSPEQLRGAIRQASELLRGRIDALGDTYNRGMNTKTEPVKLLSQKAQDTLERLGAAPARAETKAPAGGAGPARDEIEAEMKRRGLAP